MEADFYMSTVAKWQAFWKDKTIPMHRQDTAEHYRCYAAELRILFDNRTPRRVLEIGCGNGALYKYLGFGQTQYKGIDFSESMLAEFKKKYPSAKLECCDGHSYQDSNKYDLIFSNGLIQYFNSRMFDQHLAHVKAMMKPGSLFICASIPWKLQRFRYFCGELGGGHRRSPIRGVVRSLIPDYRNNMGAWYNFRSIKDKATKHGMSVKFYGSMHYLYRFHAVMKLRTDT